jgi:hypothetical protein
VKPSRVFQTRRIQQWLEAESRLLAVSGPCEIELETRVGKRVKVSAGAVAVAKALEEAGCPSDYKRPQVLRMASKVLLNRDITGR